MSHIFISYSTKNSDYAYKLADKLRDEGFDVWIDNDKLRASQDWWDTIEKALDRADAFIVIMSPDSQESRWVQREITIFDNKYKGERAFPLLLDGDMFNIYVRTQVTDVRNKKLPSDKFYEQLADFVQHSEKRGNDITGSQDKLPNSSDGVTKNILSTQNQKYIAIAVGNVYSIPLKNKQKVIEILEEDSKIEVLERISPTEKGVASWLMIRSQSQTIGWILKSQTKVISQNGQPIDSSLLPMSSLDNVDTADL